jgi:GT2 family glycosyltransferase
MNTPKVVTKNVAVVTVTYGERWQFLSKVADSVINEKSLLKLVIIDNASLNKKEIDEYAEIHKDTVVVIRNEKNEGSAGGFAQGLSFVKDLDCEYILLLDDDNVADGAIPKFLEAILLHDKKAILSGNRSSVGASTQDFFLHPEKYVVGKRTLFDIFSFDKIKNFFAMFSSQQEHLKMHKIVEVKSFAYGGAFIPKQALIDSPLPDKKLWTYCDDIAYSWGIIDRGYRCFAYFDIHIKDIDFTFSGANKNSHLVDLLLPQVSDVKVYYRMRNAVKISWDHSKQWKITLLLSVMIWYIGLLLLFIIKKRKFGMFQIKRAKLIATAFYRGLVGNMRPF